MEKAAVRRDLRQARRALSREDVSSLSYRIARELRPILAGGASTVMLYIPINNEVDLLPLAKDLFMSGRTILFPRVTPADEIEPWVIRDLFTDFVQGAYNIPEPDTEPYTGTVDLALIPGLAFDRDGYRIGYGKGYYDRFLALNRVRMAVGCCYAFQALEKLPHGPQDRPVNTVVTEKGIFR